MKYIIDIPAKLSDYEKHINSNSKQSYGYDNDDKIDLENKKDKDQEYFRSIEI